MLLSWHISGVCQASPRRAQNRARSTIAFLKYKRQFVLRNTSDAISLVDELHECLPGISLVDELRECLRGITGNGHAHRER